MSEKYEKEETSTNILSAAAYLVSHRKSRSCAKCRLSCMLYFASERAVKETGESMFQNCFRKERKGMYPECPVLEGVFDDGQVTITAEELDEFAEPLDDAQQKLLDAMEEKYGNMPSSQLIKVINDDVYWCKTARGKAICFGKRA